MKPRILFVIIIVCGLLQATFLPYLRLWNVQPDLLLVCVVVAGLSCDLGQALVLALVAGFFKDLLHTQAFGSNTLLFALWVFLLKEFSRRVTVETKILRVILVFVTVMLNDLTARFIGITLGNHLSTGIFLRVLILESFYTALVSPLIFKVSE